MADPQPLLVINYRRKLSETAGRCLYELLSNRDFTYIALSHVLSCACQSTVTLQRYKQHAPGGARTPWYGNLQAPVIGQVARTKNFNKECLSDNETKQAG